MTRGPVTVAPDASIAQACRLMEQHGIKRLPVVENDTLVGLIARADLVRASPSPPKNPHRRRSRMSASTHAWPNSNGRSGATARG